MSGLVEVEGSGSAAIITLRREAKLNALSTALERELSDALRDERVRASPCVIVAGGTRAFAGHCLGGGLEVALACDFRVADTTASFGLPEVGIGIVPSSGGTLRLARLVGGARAKELVLLRERFGPKEAHALGLVTEVVAPGGALDRAIELAEKLAALPPLAVTLAKQTIDAMPESSREAGLVLERLAYGLLAQTEDAREAADAFVEKREPRFKGR